MNKEETSLQPATTDEKKSFGSSFAEDMSRLLNYTIHDVIIPQGKKIIHDIFISVVDSLFGYRPVGSVGYKEPYANRYNSGGYSGGYRYNYERSSINAPTRSSVYEDNSFLYARVNARGRMSTRGDAEEAIFKLQSTIRQYGHVTVADLNEFTGNSGSFTDNDYGWSEIRVITPYKGEDGNYYLKLSKPMPIEM